jgi:NAD(P) transhydrogenase subunit alpha
VIKKYRDAGISILAETGFGNDIGLDLSAMEGVTTSSRKEILAQADILYTNLPLGQPDLAHVKAGALLVSFYQPFQSKAFLTDLEGKPVTAFSLDMIPRSTLAQSMDSLSSMASIAGYKAVLVAALRLARYFPMMMTAAGTIRPAKVVILGAGVAGLQAIATAKRLGAKVSVFDVRKAVKEEVQSLGAKFIEVEGSKDDQDAGGYAVEQTEAYQQKQKQLIHDTVKDADVVITTAQLRGKAAPILVTRAMVEDMKFGAVIVDLASSSGGNCELTVDEQETLHQGVTIIGDSYLYNKALIDASSLLANNIVNFVQLFVKDGALVVDSENEILSSAQVYPL